MERAKFGYFIVLSLILHIFLLIAFRVNIQQKVEGLRPTYVRIVDLPFFENETGVTPKTKSEKGETKKSSAVPPLSRGQGPLNPPIFSPDDIPGTPEGKMKSGSEGINNLPPHSDPSGKGIRGLPLLTDQDLERLAKVEEPSIKKKEKTITLDTEEFKYLSYLERLKNRIEFIWKYPEVARVNRLQGDLYIKFSILKNGRLGNTQILHSSGYKILDDAAIQALRNSDPFWSLPESWDMEELTITGHFIYYLGGMYLR